MYVCSSTKPGLLTSFSVDPALDQLIANWTVKLEDSRREFPWGIQDLSFNPRQEFTFFSMGQKKSYLTASLNNPGLIHTLSWR